MKTDNNKTSLENRIQTSYFEESIFDILKPEIIEQSLEVVEQSQKDQESPDMSKIIEDSEILLEIINEQADSKRTWQIMAACLVTFAVILSVTCSGLYIGRGNQTVKIDKAQAGLQKANYDFIQADQKVKTLESQLTKSDTERKSVQDELTDTRAEVQILKIQLFDANQRIKSLLNRNDQAVKRLNERLQKLSD